MKGEDTLERRCEGHDMSPRLDRPMTTGEDTSGEGVRATILAQIQTVVLRRAETPQEKV